MKDTNKRPFICELLYAHTQHDLALRIKIVQDLKTLVKDEDTLYSILAYMI